MKQKSSQDKHKSKNRQNIIQLGKMDFQGKINFSCLTPMSTPTVNIDVFTSFFAVQCKYSEGQARTHTGFHRFTKSVGMFIIKEKQIRIYF